MLEAEDFVDLEKLFASGRHGIPDKVRGAVWKYLLDVSKPDKGTKKSDLWS